MAASMLMCFDGYTSGSAKRYRLELLLIRVLKGLAFVIFFRSCALAFLCDGNDEPEEPAKLACQSARFLN